MPRGGYQRQETFQPVNIDQGAAARSASLAQAIGDFQRIAERTVTPILADREERAGAAAGAAGAPSLKTGSNVFAQAYNRGAIAAYEASARNDARARLADLEQQNSDNPEAFQQQVAELRRGMIAELQQPVANVFLPIFDDMATGAGIRVKARFIESQTRKNQAEVLSAIDGMAADARQAAREGNLSLYGKLAGDMTRYVALNSKPIAEGGTGFLDPVRGQQILRSMDAAGDEQIVLGQFERELTASLDRGKAVLARVQAGKDGGLHLDPELRDQLVTKMGVLVNRKESEIHERMAAAKAAQAAQVAALDDDIDNAFRAFKLGFPLPASMEAMAAQVTALPADNEKRRQFQRDLSTMNYLAGIGFPKMAPAAQRDVITHLATEAHADGASPQLVHIYETAQDIYARQAAAFKADPYRLAIEQGIAPDAPLDGQNLDASLVARADGARRASAHFGQPVPGFTAEELDSLGRQYREGTADDRIGLLGKISATQGQKQAAAVFEALDKQNHTQMALAGVLMKDSPQAARAVAQGDIAAASTPAMVPPKADFQSDLPGLLGNAYGIGTRARATIEDGIKAAYVGLSADAGDASGVLDRDRLEKAVNLVTGGLVKWRGNTMPAPSRGVTQDQFSTWAMHLEAKDFEGVAGVTPQQAAEAFHRGANLVATGPGRYGVAIDSPDGVPRVLRRADGQPVTLTFRPWQPLGGPK